MSPNLFGKDENVSERMRESTVVLLTQYRRNALLTTFSMMDSWEYYDKYEYNCYRRPGAGSPTLRPHPRRAMRTSEAVVSLLRPFTATNISGPADCVRHWSCSRHCVFLRRTTVRTVHSHVSS